MSFNYIQNKFKSFDVFGLLLSRYTKPGGFKICSPRLEP